MPTVYTTCRYCEANCALAVDVADNRAVRIRPDRQNPQTWRDACSKGLTARELVEHPQRITAPMKRVGDRYVAVSYEEAVAGIAAQLGGLRDRFGADAVGYYYGNPLGFSSGLALSTGFVEGLGTRNRFSVCSIDQNNNHVVSQALFGHIYVPFNPDIDHADYLLLVGMNPAESKFSWLGSASDGWQRARRAMARGARVVVVDPRATRTARQASAHIAIIPGQDWAFLLGLLKVVIAERRYRRDAVERLPPEQWRQLQALAREADLADLARRCGVAAATIAEVARDFAAARRGMCLTQTGVSMHATGTIGHWLGLVLDIVSGHLDQPGGRRWDPGYVNMTEIARKSMPPETRSRVRGLPTVMGYRALAELPDEIAEPGPGQLRGLIMQCGNPVVSGPNGRVLDAALAGLDCLVAVDLVQRESHRHAHWLIPGVHWLERGELIYNLAGGMDQPHAQYAAQALEPPPGVRPEWEFFVDLALAMGVPMLGRRGLNAAIRGSRRLAAALQRPELAFSPRTLERLMVGMGRTVSWRQLREHPHGLEVGPRTYGGLARQMGRRQIQIAPPAFVEELQQLLRVPTPAPADYPLLMISKRTNDMMNSWHMDLPNMQRRQADNACEIHPDDARPLGIEDGGRVCVESAVGRIELRAQYSTRLRPGVVCIQHGWGSRVFDPAAGPDAVWASGVNRNLLVDHRETDPFSGMPRLSSTPVRCRPLGEGGSEAAAREGAV